MILGEIFNSHPSNRDDYVCCERDFKYHFYYNKHMFLVHGLKTNVRVKPTQGLLLGQVRAMRVRCLRATIVKNLIDSISIFRNKPNGVPGASGNSRRGTKRSST